ncbi:MAG: radical SAM protein [Candidatus Eisenbacteria bacterium]|nr:radical SAM protein [Candidatus Eisenbacteria bacterium]
MTKRTGSETGAGREQILRREDWLIGRPDAAHAPADSLTVAMCYPETYGLGMSNLGFQTAFRSFAEHPRVHCERAFFDAPRASDEGPRRPPGMPEPANEEASMGEGAAGRGVPEGAESVAAAGGGSSLETGTPLCDFDLLAFSVSYESDYVGLARMLAAAGVPVLASDRSRDDPIVIMGGICALMNPEPVAHFLDAVAVGDARRLCPVIADSLLESRESDRDARLSALAGLAGLYVPSLYDVERDGDGRVTGFSPRRGAPLPVVAAWCDTSAAAETCVVSSDAHFGDTFLTELSTGCARRCKYCAAGHVYHPARFHDASGVADRVRELPNSVRRVGLVSAALADHPGAVDLLEDLIDVGAEVTISSVHADRVDERLAGLLAGAGARTVTLAPETGSERLRGLIGKPVADDVLLSAARTLGEAGIETLKLYFMVGLPGEDERDVEGIPVLARDLLAAFTSKNAAGRMTVGISAFVPKPRTPFQWLPMEREELLRGKLARLRRALAAGGRVAVTTAGPREARREGVLARGGRELSGPLLVHAIEGVPWRAALRRKGVEPGDIVDRLRDPEEVFPWEIIELGVPRAKLLASLRETGALYDL